MKVNAALQRKVEDQLGAEAISEQHPAMPKLVEAYGEHTFFLTADGLNIVEPDAAIEGTNGNVVKLASWTADRTQLEGHAPQVLAVTIDLDASENDPSA